MLNQVFYLLQENPPILNLTKQTKFTGNRFASIGSAFACHWWFLYGLHPPLPWR